MKRSFQRGAVSVLLLAALFVPSESGGAQPEGREYQIKAAFLYNFARFVSWPDEAFSSAEAPLVLALYGENPFGSDIFLLEKKTISGRPVRILVIPQGQPPPSECHLVFIPFSYRADAPELIKELAGRPVVLAGEWDRFAAEGGVFNFYIQSGRVAFEVNLETARSNHIEISSRLLKLARIVKDITPPSLAEEFQENKGRWRGRTPQNKLVFFEYDGDCLARW